MENGKPLQEVAKALDITDNQLRYWLKLLGDEPVRTGKLRLVKPSTESRIQEMVEMIRQGTPPKDAAAKVNGSHQEAAIVTTPSPGSDSLEEIKKVLLLLVEENRALRLEVSAMKTRLEYQAPQESKTTEEEKPLLVKVPDIPAPIALEVPRKVVEKPVVQRELSLWESVRFAFDDFAGLVFGRG
jgi:transposase-like protein